MKKLILIIPIVFLVGCASKKTQAKIASAVQDAVDATSLLCMQVLSKQINEDKDQLLKCEKDRKYWEDEYKELINPK